MKWFKKRNKNINDLKDKLNPIYDCSETEKQILVSGNRSLALGARDFPIPTGICGNPVSEELEEYIKQDKLGQLLRNPIHHCVFYDKSTGYCFFAGSCNEKQEINNSLVEQYKNDMKKIIDNEYTDIK
jgi:hypothetical protein